MIKELFRKKSIDLMLKTAEIEQEKEGSSLKKNLRVKDLTALGIAAIIGAGIFSTIGTAAVKGGPAVSLLFIFTAIACGLSALSYAQFASYIPLSGSAYTYAYASFGELIAWIIGWDLIMEYAVGNIAVAISWSDYFTSFLTGFHLHIPEFLTMDYYTALHGFKEAVNQISSGLTLQQLNPLTQDAYNAWINAPNILGIRIIADVPAFVIVVFITALVYIGIYETKVASNLMVLLKLLILFVVIGIGAFYVNPQNWSPFAPHGIAGVLKGVSGVFFAYIGFDAISTTAEECRNPQKDLPKSMILSLIITTILYVAIALILTGMVNYKELAVGDPLAYVFQKLNLTWLSGIIAFGAIIAMASVLLVFQVGQPRIWMSMSRDGLLPKKFSNVHKRFKTPWFATLVTGIFVATPTLFVNLNEMADLTSIGTLFAFVLVSAGILIIDKNHKTKKGTFKVPYINSRFWLPIIWIGFIVALLLFSNSSVVDFFLFKDPAMPNATFWKVFWHSSPMMVFCIVSVIISFFAITRKWSLIPVLAVIVDLYLMSNLGITNWLRFFVWLIIGLFIYFLYGRNRSKLNDIIE